MAQTVITKSAGETQKLAADIAKQKEDLQVIALRGDLGAGKTTFTQGFANAIGITKRLISPTFIIMRTYELPDDPKSKKKFFYHVDLYRIQSMHDVEDLGLLEVMHDPQNIVVIEWPEKLPSGLPDAYKELSFTTVDDDARKIIIEDKDGNSEN